MSANSSGPGKPVDGSSPGSSKPEKGMDEERTRRSLPNTPMSRSDTARSKSQRSRSPSMSNLELSQGHERDKSNPHVQPHGKETSTAPDPPIGGTPFSKSCLPAISADGNSRSSSLEEKPGDVLKVAEEKSLDPSKYTREQNEESTCIGDEKNHRDPSRQKTSSLKEKKVDVKSIHNPSQCITEPADEIPYVDSEVNCQGAPEQSTPQTEGTKSLRGETSRAPNQTAGDPRFSKTCLSTESSSQAGKRDTIAMHLNRSLNAASLNKYSSDHEILRIQWNMEQKIKRNETFEITLYHGKRIKYVIQITCMPEDFHRLKFLFCNTNTVEDLSKSLLEIDCTLKNGTNEVRLGSKIFLDKSEIIRDKIEGVINNVKATSNIQVHCAETSIAEDKLVEKCEEFSSEFKRGNIAVYEKGKRVWIVGRNNEEMEVLEKRLIEGNVLQKAPYSSKGPFSQTNIDCERNAQKESLQSSTADSANRPSSERKKKMSKSNYIFALDPGMRLKDEEWELHIECAFPEIYKMIYIFSSENCKSHAKEHFKSMNISLTEMLSSSSKVVCECIKPMGQMKLDISFIRDAISVCNSLLSMVDITKLTMHPNIEFKQIRDFCSTRHLAYSNSTILLFQDEEKNDEFWVAVEKTDQKLGIAVVEDLHDSKMASKYSSELENHDLRGYFVQKADFNEIDIRLFNFLKKNKSFAERYKDVNVSSSGKQVLILNQNEVQEDLFKNIRKDISVLSRIKQRFSVSPSLRKLLNYHEAVEFVNQTVHAEHNESVIWTVTDQSNTTYIEIYALQHSTARNGMQTIQGCFKEREFDITQLQREALQLPILEGDRFRGKIAQMDMKNNCVKISGTIDIFDEYIDLLQNELKRLTKPVCKTVEVKSRNVLSFCETHYEINFREWKKSVEIDAVYRDGTGRCGFTIKGSAEKVKIIGNELKKISSDIKEKQFEEKLMDIMHLTGNRQFRRQRCDIEKEWNVDTILEGIPGQDWSVEDGFEWCFKKGLSVSLMTLKSALPVKTDVVLHPYPKQNVKGNHQKGIQDYMNRDWHALEFEVEHNQSGKAKDFFRESLYNILLTGVKGDGFQTLVFPLEEKFMERIGWSKTHYLKQILVVLIEKFKCEPWSIYFLCENQEDFRANVETLETHFQSPSILKRSLRTKAFHIQETLKPAINIQVNKGSLVQTKADVIVNTTYKDLKSLHLGHVSGSILKAAGSELSKHCTKVYPKGIEYSQVAVTPSFGLQLCKEIYHGSLPAYKKNFKPLTDFVWNCLLQANWNNMQTIAFPAIGTGNLGYPSEGVAETMINAVEKFSEKYPTTTLLCVYFVIFDDKTFKDFQKRNGSALKAEGNQSSSEADKAVRITVVGSLEKAEEAAKRLHHFIKKKEENSHDMKSATAVQPLLDKGSEKSKTVIVDHEKDIQNKSDIQSEQVSNEGGSWNLVFVKKALDSDSSLLMSECKSYLNPFKYKKIICPFGNTCQALVKFESKEDADEVLTNFKSDLFKFKKNPPQAVHDVKAKLGKETIHFIKTNKITEEEIGNRTGASLDTNEWIITGSLLEIKQAEEFFKRTMAESSESKKASKKTSLHQNQQTHEMVSPIKVSIECTYPELEAVKHFNEDVFSKLFFNHGLEGLYCVSGKQDAIDEFSNTLLSLCRKTVINVSSACFKRVAKYPGVYCYFDENLRKIYIFAKLKEKLKYVEEIIQKFDDEMSGPEKMLNKKILESQIDDFSNEEDDKNVQNYKQYTMEADEYDTVCHFHKEFLTKLQKKEDGMKVHLIGQKDLIERLMVVQKEIREHFYSERLEYNCRDDFKINKIYTDMTMTRGDSNVHMGVKTSGFTITVLFTSKSKEEVVKMTSWFEDEFKKMTENNERKHWEKKNLFTPKDDFLIFQEGGVKVFAVKGDILQIRTDAIVCPSTQEVGKYIRRETGSGDQGIGHLKSNIVKLIRVPGSKVFLMHTKVPKWYEYAENDNPCEDCIKDIESLIDRCILASSSFESIAVPDFFSDKLCQLPAVICCMAFARGVQHFSKSSPISRALNIYYVDNNKGTTNLMKMCFNQEVNWEYIADYKCSTFYFHSTFQVHVEKADIFKYSAFALAASQDNEIKSERFIASELCKMEDEEYKSAIKSLKAKNLPAIVPAPYKCDYVKVIHFLSPNWTTKPKKDLLKENRKSIKSLLDCASQECSSVVIPLSGGRYTDLELRKKIAESTVVAVADWCKENAKRLRSLKTIYILNNDIEYIKTTIDCFRNHIWQDEFSCVKRPPFLA